jgi:hypothetical protein
MYVTSVTSVTSKMCVPCIGVLGYLGIWILPYKVGSHTAEDVTHRKRLIGLT